MVPSATHLILLASEPKEEKGALQATAPLLPQCPEDFRLAEQVEQALRASGYGALGSVRVSVNGQVVILVGSVTSYYLKQIAQTTALLVPGVHQVRNDLRVAPN